ncbi:MAG: FdtA/QdtA family cupin domain-containing protein, partial [Oscillospiraceae bacterium]
MRNVRLIDFPCNKDPNYGSLVPVEGDGNVPFDIRRIYYIYGVPTNTRRGFHSHRDLQQALVCVHGSVTIMTKTPYEEENTVLDDPTKA